MSVKSYIDIREYSKSKKAYMCYPSMCGSMTSTVNWAHRYVKKDTDFALKVLDLAIKEREKVKNVIERFNRRFG
tara:strand:- start:727 stop:948 length:222 start_codon:yes stop_codon:yes gene_type:complete